MGKLIICHGEENDYEYGVGKTIAQAFNDYSNEHNGLDTISECKFYEAAEIEIEFVIKRKETAASAAKK